MNFTEFKRILGAEPRRGDDEFLRARNSGPEFEQAAAEAERFEQLLERALAVPAPEQLSDELLALTADAARPRRWIRFAMAASVLVAVGAAGVAWKMNRQWASVEEYLVDHYRYDGPKLETMAGRATDEDIQAVLAQFDVHATPNLADMVEVIKYCPTPDGKGVHMVVGTVQGPVTVIYMPETSVTDQQMMAFDEVEAMLVDLPSGSAAIIGRQTLDFPLLYSIVQNAIVPGTGSS